ncbi:hypothetical protein [Chryseobacterium sp.]|uniref:hypothetical protein n=1 Tax=Chryseobacterium sp. TaxID=1871047 RepID=UPI0025C267F7|nr:hypothetical protein [Chryseobacterium sp.]MBV8328074.1 hypothetical protein [Chryseobacterium sp.]
MKKLFILSFLPLGLAIYAQVGINTIAPKATLDIAGAPADATRPDGLIAPRLTGTQLRAKNYTTAQEGAIVYATAADTVPAGQTIHVTASGYYYFDGKSWQKISGKEWHTQGNTTGEISTQSEVLGSSPVSANYLGTIGNADLVLISANKVHAVLNTGGALNGGGEDASSFSWGRANQINNLSNNIALGKGNNADTNNKNNPAIAIGSSNNVSLGGKAFGVGNSVMTNFTSFAFGAKNTALESVSYGIGFGNEVRTRGFAFGTNNKVYYGFALGSTNGVTGTVNQYGIALGNQGKSGPNQSVYANIIHAFFNEQNTGKTMVGINMIPTADNATGTALQMKGVDTSSGGTVNTCSSAEEGAIRYNRTLKVHEGCSSNGVWKAFY